MELATASDTGFVTYTYNGRATIVLDNHHDEYEIDVEKNDQFKVKVEGTKVTIIHLDEPKLKFRATTTDKAYLRLMKSSTPDDFQFVPHPKYPSYPFIPNLTYELIPKLYAYFNEKYFNGMCPKSLLFKKSQGASSPFGLAQFNSVGGKPLYRMTVNMKRISADMILFVDTLLHEMIHLYLFRKGIDEGNNSILHDGHGRYFQAEMQRINRAGFNISILLDWEKREAASDVETNVLRVFSPEYPNHAKYYWSVLNLEDKFDDLVRQVRENDPTKSYVIDLIVTSQTSMRDYPQISKNGKIPPSKLPLWWKVVDPKGRLIKAFDVKEQGASQAIGKLKVSKKEEPYYAQPFPMFASWMRKEKASGTDDQIRAIWEHFPAAKIFPYAEEELIDIEKAITRGLADQEVKRKLTAVFARFDGRCSHYDYRVKIREIITRRKLDALLRYPQLGI